MSEEYRVSYRLGLVCPDCGADMDDSYDEGDVCEKCWDGYGGLTAEEIVTTPNEGDVR